jgi:hypothetical protein
VKSGSGSGRGRHRNAGSPETKRWRELEPELAGDAWKPSKPDKRAAYRKRKPKIVDPMPECPSWLSLEEWEMLRELRGNL